jgi:alpha-L-fucosidase
MIHWTSEITPRHGAPKPYNEAVRDFDLQTFVRQVERSGAKFVTFTTSHGKMFFPAPLRSLDKIMPGRTSERDLVAELADALNAKGIRLILYYHLGANSDEKWQAASGFFKTDTSDFWNNWASVIGEAGERYGDKLAGWWFDDGTANYYYRSAPWERLATTAKSGNPKRLICFNPWILPPATEFQDYLAGEGNSDPTLKGSLKADDQGRISGGVYAGLQASSALIMEGDWNHTKRDTEISPPKMKLEQLQSILTRFQALENVLMFNCEIYQDGTLSPATVELLHGLKPSPGKASR